MRALTIARDALVIAIAACPGATATYAANDARDDAPDDAQIVAGDLGRDLDRQVQHATGGGFWGAVLVAQEGDILLAKGNVEETIGHYRAAILLDPDYVDAHANLGDVLGARETPSPLPAQWRRVLEEIRLIDADGRAGEHANPS